MVVFKLVAASIVLVALIVVTLMTDFFRKENVKVNEQAQHDISVMQQRFGKPHGVPIDNIAKW